MGGSENSDMRLQPENDGHLSYASPGMNSKTLPKVSGASAGTYFASGWDPIASFSQSENFGVSSVVSHCDFPNSLYAAEMENRGMSSNSLVQYPAASSYAELVPKVNCYGSGNYSEMVGSLGLGEHGKITTTGFSRTINDSNSLNVLSTLDGGSGASPEGKKRKRAPDLDSPQEPKKIAEEGLQKNLSQETSEVAKQDASKPKTEKNNDNMQGKQMGKQAAESSHSGEASKDNYIHVRARRGQATNSHSLAERLRREKISERMRLLQELVPGCNKITGKAVMLDEIINYVQSLQQQVEFLSMKLATVNPELQFDMERILSKDFSQGVGSAAHGFIPGMSSSQLGNLQGSFPAMSYMIPQYNPLPQPVLDNDFQTLLQMGYNSSSATDNMGPNGRSRPEL